MNSREVEPLWRAAVGETEPWRRGRLFLVLLAVLTFCLQCLSFGRIILAGDIQRALVLGIVGVVFWLQFYFIWIGVHWVRWLSGAWNALVGFILIIWGFRDGVNLAIGVGIYLFAIGAYLGLAPSVYFFARRQRETVRWKESLAIAAVFLLLLASLGAGMLGLMGYKAHLEEDGRHFADTAFKRIFAEHDTYFFLDHVTDHLMETGGGRGRLTRFLQDATIRAGDVREISRSAGWLRCWYLFPSHLGSEGEMIAEGVGVRGRIRMHLKLVEAGGGWKIEAVWWIYPELASPRPPSG
jgi:uncharacterized protein (DUF983 family)